MKPVLKYLLTALAITLLAFPLTWLLILNPFEREADFALSDFYTRAAARKAQTVVSNDVAVVGVDGLSRLEIARVVDFVDWCEPAAVALDVFMNYPSPTDDEVREALSGCATLVLPCNLAEPDKGPVFGQLTPAATGFVNLETTQLGEIVRRFRTAANGTDSFAAAAIRCAGREVKDIPAKALVSFQGREFDVIEADELSALAQGLKGKIVLVGNLNDASDCHPTPVGEMAGVLIHAHIIQTLLDGSAPRDAGPFWKFLCAFCICLLLMWAHVSISAVSSDIANLTLRVTQLIMMYLIYLLGSEFFIHAGIYIDFSLTILLVAAASVAFDICFGLVALLPMLKHAKRK